MSYRPEGWDALDIYAATEHIGMTLLELVEAGADAVLMALKEGDGSEYYPPEEGRPQSGWVVFIPDEEK